MTKEEFSKELDGKVFTKDVLFKTLRGMASGLMVLYSDEEDMSKVAESDILIDSLGLLLDDSYIPKYKMKEHLIRKEKAKKIKDTPRAKFTVTTEDGKESSGFVFSKSDL